MKIDGNKEVKMFVPMAACIGNGLMCVSDRKNERMTTNKLALFKMNGVLSNLIRHSVMIISTSSAAPYTNVPSTS
jgi:hypothetical protein